MRSSISGRKCLIRPCLAQHIGSQLYASSMQEHALPSCWAASHTDPEYSATACKHNMRTLWPQLILGKLN